MYSTKVSVVTAVYNGAKYLDRYFNSLINQTMKEIEIICVNNASTDNSLELLNKYALSDKRIRVINNSENNIGGAINIAIMNANSKYICPVDQDDWIDINMFQTLIDHSEGETVDMVCSDYYEYHSKDNIKKIVNIPSSSTNSVEDIKKHVIINGGRLFTNIIRKSLFVNNDLFYPEKLSYPDNAISAVLYCKAEKINKVNEHFYFYNMENSSLTRSKNNYSFFNRLTTSNLLLDNMKRCGLYDKYKEEVDYSFYKLFYRNSITGCFSRFTTYPKDYVNHIKSEFNSNSINIKNNVYFIHRRKNYEDIIIAAIELSTNLGYLFFAIYKFLIPLKFLISKKK